MNSAEKPFEQLSSQEKDIFNICGEIIGYKRQKGDAAMLKLREQATELFAKMRKINLSEHDSYFQLIAEANELRKEFVKIKDDLRASEYIEFNLDKDSSDKIINELILALANTKSIRTSWDWVLKRPLNIEEQGDTFYNDVTIIDVFRQEKSDRFELRFNEMFNYTKFKGLSHIQAFIKTFQFEDNKISEHDHQDSGVKEFWLTMKDLTQDRLREILKNFIEIIKSHPRISNDE